MMPKIDHGSLFFVNLAELHQNLKISTNEQLTMCKPPIAHDNVTTPEWDASLNNLHVHLILALLGEGR